MSNMFTSVFKLKKEEGNERRGMKGYVLVAINFGTGKGKELEWTSLV